MANVKALCIRGIRSFGPDDGDQQYISFNRPLTLILGQNGCGKTTIIECLRYAVTGQQPPGSRNECFVYDAKVNKTREVMGQAKLKIVNAVGHELTVTRSMLVTSKEKKTQFKTLDGSIERINERGVRSEISSRCADIDHIMQEELGVSKAIINSVIFCHQEDSSWPLEEGKKVKERFDEIFDADKYSDCFDRLKKIRKEYAVKIKLLEQDVLHLTEKKSDLDRKKIEMVNTQKKIEEAELKMASLSSELRPVMDRIRAVEVVQRNLVELENKKNKANTRLEHCLSQQRELKKAIKNIFEGSDQELQRSIDNYDTDAGRKQHRATELTQKSQQLGGAVDKTVRESSATQVRLNRLQLLEGQHQERLADRASVITEAATRADVSVPEDLENPSEAARGVVLLTQASRNLHSKLETLQCKTNAEQDRLQKIVDDCRDALTRHDQKILGLRSEQESIKRKIEGLQQDLADADRSRAQLDSLQAQLDQAEKEYERLSAEIDREKCQNEISTQEKVVEKLEAEAEQLDETMSRLQQKSAKLAEKKALEESLSSREKALGVLKNKHRSALTELLGTVPERGFALAVSEVECATRTEVDSVTKQLKQKQDEMTKLESERTHVRELLKSARAELTAAEDKMYQACGSLSYDAALAKVDATVEKLRDEQSTLQSSVFIINKHKKVLEESSSCPLCNRGFDSQSEVVQLISELTTKVINVPATLERVSEQLSRQAARRDELVTLGSLRDKMATLKDDTLPSLERRLSQLDQKLSENREAVEEGSMSLAEPERRLLTAKQIAGDMPLLDRYAIEIEAATRDLRALAAQCGADVSEATLEETAVKQKELRHKMSLLRANVKSKQAALNAHTSKLQAAAANKNKLKEELLEVEKKTRQAGALRAALETARAELERGAAQLRELQGATPALQNQLERERIARDKLVENARQELEAIRSSMAQLDSSLDKIRSLDREIKQHEEKEVQKEMEKLKEMHQELQQKKNRLEKEREEIAKNIDEIKDELAKQEIYKRDLTDNVKLRAAIVEAAECEKEMAEASAAAGGLDTAALADKENLIRKQTSIFSERAQTEGKMEQLRESLKSGRSELDRPLHRDLEDRFRRQFYELEVLRALDRDIKDYSAAMDKCLMQFHSEKMSSINLIIRDMWRKIYRGNDIDYIEIKTGGSETAGERRKYEYRVVQCKNGVEIDMRGRCSAGQKVLACLIIRLALAETFSTRFGVLALDEPTTNLDQDNIKSLCRALGDMVRERAVQKNFMFILITHDKEFIESLGHIDKVTHFYEVSRNDDGKSRIKKRSL